MTFVIGGGQPIYACWIGVWLTKISIARVSQAGLGRLPIASIVCLIPMQVRTVGMPQCKQRVGRETATTVQGRIYVCYSTSRLATFVDIPPAASLIDVQGARGVITPLRSASGLGGRDRRLERNVRRSEVGPCCRE